MRRLRIAAFYACLVLFLTGVMLWAHSYRARTHMGRTEMPYRWGVDSWQGVIALQEADLDVNAPRRPSHWLCKVSDAKAFQLSLDRARGYSGEVFIPQPFTFKVRKSVQTARDGREWYAREVALPYWFLVVSSGVAAVLCRPSPRFRFSLGDTLAVTAIVAILTAVFNFLT